MKVPNLKSDAVKWNSAMKWTRVHWFITIFLVFGFGSIAIYLLNNTQYSQREYLRADRLGNQIVWERMTVVEAEKVLLDNGLTLDEDRYEYSETDNDKVVIISGSADMDLPFYMFGQVLRIYIRFEDGVATEHYVETYHLFL